MKIPLLVNSFMNRDNFGFFLLDKGFGKKETAVEVGTHKGVFAATLLSKWPGRLICVDHYKSNYDDEEIDEVKGDREIHYKEALDNLSQYIKRYEFLLTSSRDAAAVVSEESLCFVYVDACHQYEDTKEDLELWWPKLKTGGILAGHDIVCTGEKDGGFGRYIQRAVFEFALERDLVVHFVTGPETLPWSYYMIKQE